MTKKVIIIDDSSLQLNVLKMKFSKDFWQVHIVKNSIEAYSTIYEIAPDLIITDAIMPHVSGFGLVKTIRNDEKISKIPIIIYSVLPENNVKLYLKKERPEFFFSKEKNVEELISFANETCKKNPLPEKYKNEILNTKKEKVEENIKKIEPNTVSSLESIKEKLEQVNFLNDDKKILSDCFNILYSSIDYNLAIACVEDEEEGKTIFFDIRNIILSPILQSTLLKEYDGKTPVLNKQYAPNLKIIHLKEDFSSKAEFNFNYLDKNIGKITIFSLKTHILTNEDKEFLENTLFNFFRTRFVKKNSQKKKTEKYFTNNSIKLEKNIEKINEYSAYCAIVKIANYQDLAVYLSIEDIDILNIKITQIITQYLENDEKIFKETDDEFSLVIFEKENELAQKRLKSLNDALNSISIEGLNLKSLIGVSNCNFNGKFDLKEAQKTARKTLETIQKL